MPVSLHVRHKRGDIKGDGPKKKGLVPEINVTPLVDVVLVLLIIFMVISPQLEAGERVELPLAQNVAKKNELNVLTVTMTQSGKLMLEKDVMSRDRMFQALQVYLEQDPGKKLVLKVDRGVSYGKVRELFQSAQDIGFRGVGLMVQEAAPAREEKR
jgi:biopolymer transport protein TolR